MSEPPRPDRLRGHRGDHPSAKLARHATLVSGRDSLLEPDGGTIEADPRDRDLGRGIGEERFRPCRIPTHLVRDPGRKGQGGIEVGGSGDGEVHHGDREQPGPVGRQADEPVRDGMRRPHPVAQDGATQADLRDDPLDPGVSVDDHVVALEERPLDEEQEPHHVVQDDVPGGEHDGRDEEDDAPKEVPPPEDGQHHDDQPGQHPDAEEPEEEVLDRRDPLADLVFRARPRREVGRLGMDDGGHHAMDRGDADAVDHQQHHRADEQRDPPAQQPSKRLARIHVAPSAAATRRHGAPTGLRRHATQACSHADHGLQAVLAG